MGKTVSVFKAQPVGDPVPDLRIEATEEMPSWTHFPEGQARVMFEEQAEAVVDAMLLSLPGGTIDAILVRLLDHRRSLWVVAHSALKEG